MRTNANIVVWIAGAVLVLAAAGGWWQFYRESNALTRQQAAASAEQVRLQAEVSSLKSSLAAREQALDARAEHIAKLEVMLATRSLSLQSTEEVLEAERWRQQRVGQRLDVQQAQYRELKQAHGSLVSRSKTLEQRLTSTRGERDRLQGQLQAARQEQAQVADALAQMQAARAALQQDLEQSRATRGDLRANLDALQQKLETRSDKLAGSRAEAEATRARLSQQLQSVEADQAALRQRLDATNREIAAKQAQSQDYRQRIARLDSALIAANDDIAGLRKEVSRLQAERAADQARFAHLRASLENEIADKSVTIDRMEDRLTVIRVGGDLLFDSASARLRTAGKKTLDRIAYILKSYPDYSIRVVGHTDNRPIAEWLRFVFPSNWNLSTARAANAARYLQNHAGIDASRLRVIGRSAYDPVASNESAAGRAKNRRIEIQMVPPDYGEYVAAG